MIEMKRHLTLLLIVALAGCGSSDGKKPPGDPCKGNSDCADQVCHRSVCVPPAPVSTGNPCKGDQDCLTWKCENGTCVKGTQAIGEDCKEHTECASKRCEGKRCVTAGDLDGGVHDGATHDGATPDTATPDTATPDIATPDTATPDTVSHDTISHDTVSHDTVSHDTVSPDTVPACIPGYACNDGDPKTYGDMCDSSGVCKGIPVVCIPPSACHKPTYNGTYKCTPYVIKAKTCALADTSIPPVYTCYAEGTGSASDPCKVCNTAISNTYLSYTDAKGCVTTIAGTGAKGYVDGPAAAAAFNAPVALALDETKQFLYVVDTNPGGGAKIRYMDLNAKTVHTLVGPLGSKLPTSACQDTQTSPAKLPFFKMAGGAALDANGDLLVADRGCFALRKVFTGTKTSPTKDSVQTVAGQLGLKGTTDGPATSVAKLSFPSGVAVTPNGKIYIGDGTFLRELASSTVSTVLISCPGFCGRVVAASNSKLYYSNDYYTSSGIYEVKIAMMSAYVYTGFSSGHADGTLTTAKFTAPQSLAYLNDTVPILYTLDYGQHVLRMVKGGQVTTPAGVPGTPGYQDGLATQAKFMHPKGVAVDSKSGAVYILDRWKIRKYTPL